MSSRSPCDVSPTSSKPDGVGNIGPPSSSTTNGGRVVVVARCRVVVGAGSVVSTAICSGRLSAALLQRRRRSTGRQVTAAGLRDHPDDSDGDCDTGADADAAAFSAIEWRTPWRLRHGRFERDMALARPLLNELDLDPLAHSPSITPQHRPAVGSEARVEASPSPSATLWFNERTGSSLERRAERVAAATDPRT